MTDDREGSGTTDVRSSPGPKSEVLIVIPRWAQAVLLPVAVFLALVFGRAMSHALFALLMAVLLALLLNPIVRSLRRLRMPRVVAVPLVYLTFVALLVVLLVVGVPVLVSQIQGLFNRVPEWGKGLEAAVGDLQRYLDRTGIPVDVEAGLGQAVTWLETHSVQSVGTVFNVGLGLAGGLATLLVVVISSFYMLIDGTRIHRFLMRVLPGDDAVMDRYLNGLQASFTRYVKGQAIVGLSMGLFAGLGVWLLGAIGVWPEGQQYALLFGVWAGLMELVPYVGPWLGGAPPTILALFSSPATALWVLVLFVVLQQIEGHVLVPSIMGSTVGVHPLVVIFSLLAAFQVAGILGMLAVLPVVSMIKHTLDFFDFRLSRASWAADDRPGPDPPAAIGPPEGAACSPRSGGTPG